MSRPPESYSTGVRRFVLEVESPRQRWRQRLGECLGHVIVPIDHYIADNCRTDPLAAKIRGHVEEFDSRYLRSGRLQRVYPGVLVWHIGEPAPLSETHSGVETTG